MKLIQVEIGQQFLMQKENRIIGENDIAIHKFENGYSLNDNIKSVFYNKSDFIKNSIEKEIDSSGFFKKNTKKEIGFISFKPESILIPHNIFDENSQNLYFNDNLSNNNKLRLYFDVINSKEIVNLYRLEEDDFFKKLYLTNKVSIVSHYKTIILNTLLKINKEDLKENIVYVNLQKDSFDIFYFIEDKFNLSNSFKINNTDDFLYYFFYFTEQFNLKPEAFSIVFLGKYIFFEDYYLGIRDFQTNISFLSNPTDNKGYIENHPAPFLANVYC